jgi:hypothetical protein
VILTELGILVKHLVARAPYLPTKLMCNNLFVGACQKILKKYALGANIHAASRASFLGLNF